MVGCFDVRIWSKLNSLLRLWGRKLFPPPTSPEEGGELPQLVVITDTLDLHGYFPEQVPQMLADFIENAHRLGLREVRIIHGKGGSIMKRLVWEKLAENPLVEEYHNAHPLFGGWGATIALLKVED